MTYLFADLLTFVFASCVLNILCNVCLPYWLTEWLTDVSRIGNQMSEHIVYHMVNMLFDEGSF